MSDEQSKDEENEFEAHRRVKNANDEPRDAELDSDDEVEAHIRRGMSARLD